MTLLGDLRADLRTGPMDPATADGTRGTAQDVYFFTSIEDFPPDVGDLGRTHDDVQGFHDYVARFNPPNGWYRDGNVGQWIYEETYDNWNDDTGFDAAKVVYHSGHGAMDDAGVFWLPVGNDWGGDHWTSSADMRLGNEYARYVFWSTCTSVRVKGGHSPDRTWGPANLGLRMIFGYETVSVDNGDYGRFFFEEWNKGKSFSTAFLDASWRISTGQEPAVTACGATQAEASDRLFNERTFLGDRAATNWWWWRWYDAARGRDRNLRLPKGTRSAKLAPAVADAAALAAWADRFGVAVPPGAREGVRGGVVLGGPAARIAMSPTGAREARLADPSDTRAQLDTDRAVQVARRAVQQYRLAESVDLVMDHVRYDRHAGAGADERVDPAVREIAVAFAQVVDGVPVVSPDAGRVLVRVDNEGNVTGISDSTREVRELRDRAVVPPRPAGRRARGPAGGADDVDDLLDGALQRTLRRAASAGRVPGAVRTVPGSTEIGYALGGGDAVLVARREVEFDHGNGLAKRHVIEEPISG